MKASRKQRPGGERNDSRRFTVAAGLQPGVVRLSVLTIYVDLPDTPLRASASDQRLARCLYDEGVSLQMVETALMLGSLRRLICPADVPKLSPIRSLAYFRPVIDELRAHPAPENYLDYLRLKLSQAAALPAKLPKSTPTDDR